VFDSPSDEFTPGPVDPTRRARRRRDLATGAGAFVAVLAAIAVIVTLTHGAKHARPADDKASPIDATAILAMTEHLFAAGRLPMSATFTDAAHGYLLLGTCPSLGAILECRQRLVATSDGGKTFSDRPLPMADPTISRMQLAVFDADHLLIDEPASLDYTKLATTAPDMPSGWPTDGSLPSDFPTDFPTDFPSGFPSVFPSDFPTAFPSGYPGGLDDLPKLSAARWISADGGRTWQSVPTANGSPVDTLPADDLIYGLTDVIGIGATVVTAIGPDGVAHPLRHAPKGARPSADPNGLLSTFAGPVGGALFLNDDNGDLQVSHDQGATWVRSVPPGGRETGIIGGDGSVVFAESQDVADNPDAPARPLYASHDGGLTWSRLDIPALTPVIGPSFGGLPVPGPSPDSSDGSDWSPDMGTTDFVTTVFVNGRLLLSDGAKVWSSDGGAFQPVGTDSAVTLTMPAGRMTLAIRGTVANPALYVSADGTHWTKLGL
jgi:hypothetical protein